MSKGCQGSEIVKYEKIEDLEEKEVHPLSVKKENFSCNILFVYGKNSLPISEIPL